MLVRYADPLVAKAVKESKTIMKAVDETEEAMMGREGPMARMVEGADFRDQPHLQGSRGRTNQVDE